MAGASVTPERVRLRIDRLGSVEAVVTRAVPGAVELALVQAPPAPARFLHQRIAHVESLDGSGTIVGTLLAVPSVGGGIRADLLHLLYAVAVSPEPQPPSPAAEPSLAGERRLHDRLETRRPVELRLPDRWMAAATRDLSVSGALLTGAGAIAAGSPVRLRLELMPSEWIEGSGRLARHTTDGLSALRLEKMNLHDRIFLQRWLKHRAALQA
jgi:hypothetical protein